MVKLGDKIKDFRENEWTLISWTREIGEQPGKSGKVLVENDEGRRCELYHTVFPILREKPGG